MNFNTIAYGKWILAGEHAVLRGSPALVFPLLTKFIKFSYRKNSSELRIKYADKESQKIEPLFQAALQKGIKCLSIEKMKLKGHLEIFCNIPLGAGLGASAALCVNIALFFQKKNYLKESGIHAFACELENLFHGESSGIDIAASLFGKGLLFQKNNQCRPIEQNWHPQLYLYHSGIEKMSADCIKKVKHLWKKKPALGKAIDNDMAFSVMLAKKALEKNTPKEGFSLLADAIDLANSCFKRWGLVNEDAIAKLKTQGARAIKPTGAGSGGYILSLWETKPPPSLQSQLLPCNSRGIENA